MSSLDESENFVYSLIVQAGEGAIWTKSIQDVAGIDRRVVKTILDSLILRNEIKRVRSQRFPTRALYMLSDLSPSFEVVTD